MERLTENKRNSDGTGVSKQSLIDRPGKGYPSNYARSIVTKLAEYEDMEEQGRLLRLPCRPNDIVYRINKAARVPIIKMAVKRIVLFDKSYALEVVDEYGGQLLFLADDIGKVLYITREETEAKLKEMEESHEVE